MAQRFYKIIVAFAVSFGICHSLCGQTIGGEAGQPLQRPHVHTDSVFMAAGSQVNIPGYFSSGSAMPDSAQSIWPLAYRARLSPSLYADHLGFFCREEWRWEKRTGIPFRFRLGSKAYVDYLEGKKP